MTIIQKLRARKAIRQAAHRQGITYHECRTAIREAITAAWSTRDPAVRQYQRSLVGDSHIPSPEELIFLISAKNT
jgi:hypothetical protein